MPETQSSGSLAEEFRQLGKNLGGAVQAAWDSPERRKFQQELENGITELGKALQEEMRNISSSSTGQRIKEDVQSIEQKVRTGEVENRVREEMLMLLRSANAHLQEAINKWAAPAGQDPGVAQGKGTDRSAPDEQSDQHQEVHPDDVSAADSNTGHQEIHPDDVEA